MICSPTEVAAGINSHDSLSVVQLHHGGVRAPLALNDRTPKSAVDIEKSERYPEGAEALTEAEIEEGDF